MVRVSLLQVCAILGIILTIVYLGYESRKHRKWESEQVRSSLRSKTTAAVIIIAAIIGLASIITSYMLDRWTQEIVATNADMTKITVHNLTLTSEHTLDSLWQAGFFLKKSFSSREIKDLDSLLSKLVAPQAITIIGMEGGFYLSHLKELVGYSWPTCPPPPPAYGPAPRSYNIILRQAERTVRENRPLLELHQFDVATFPLALEPVNLHGTTVGAVWARIHVERELPSSRIARWLSVAVGVIFLVLLIVFFMSLRMRIRVAEIRRGLDHLHKDTFFRLPVQKGIFGDISSSINSLVEVQLREQERREQLERDLHQQDKLATLGRLVAGVAHEVKTPLANMKTRIQMWQRRRRKMSSDNDTAGAISEESMNIVVDEIDRLSDLVKRLLVFSKPVTGRRQPADINGLLLHGLSILQPDAEVKRIKVKTILEDALPSVKLDVQAMEQVVLNIHMNALEATPEDGTIVVRTSLQKDQPAVVITVEDSGPGIPQDMLEKIFEPFFTTKEQGSGLGLSISYEIVRAHGGIIEFGRSDSGGALCRIILPLNQKGKPKNEE